ncbi:MAG: putative damage-inducible protein DinB [Algoriphagus sp.]
MISSENSGFLALNKPQYKMKKLIKFFSYSILLGIYFVASTSVMAQTSKEEFMSKWKNSKQFTLDVLDKMPDSGMDYTTDPAAMSFKEQIHHIGSAIVGISKGYLMGGEPDFSIDVETSTKAQLADYVAKSYDYGAKAMASITVEQGKEVQDVFGNQASRNQVMALLMDHSTHHRGAAIAYLRSNGVEPPAFIGF